MSPVQTAAPTRRRQIAIAGNPNCGKTTLFNALTGLRQKVGNYPGVTVEKKEGRFHGAHGEPMELLDLPGTYSLQARSPDEMVVRDVLLGRREDTPPPDTLICVVDANNLDRNLYLVLQLMELGLPIVVALNMIDVAEQNGVTVDVARLSAMLGTPVVPTIASCGKGLVELKQAVARRDIPSPDPGADMPEPIAAAAAELAEVLRWRMDLDEKAARAEALLLMALPDEAVAEVTGDREVVARVAEARQSVRDAGCDPVSDPVEARYARVQEITSAVVRHSGVDNLTISDRLDGVLTHRVWGWAAFLATMGFMFFCIFTIAAYPMEWIDAGAAWLGAQTGALLPDGNLRSLLTDGVIAGVGGVVVFLPQILILYFFICLLEDSGYMARAAFIIDRVMAKAGLNGKSFIPMLGSFACAIPGIMATRTIENFKDRLVTILVAPLMSCSARIPVYTLLIAVLLPPEQFSPFAKAGLMLSMYLLGMTAAFGMASLFKRTLLRGETPMLLMELPPYRLPRLRSVGVQMLQRAGLFLRRAGTIILALSIILWALATFPKHPDPDASTAEALEYSMAGRLGHGIEPLIEPLGFDWKIGVGLVASLAAREVFVGTMAIIYNIQDADQAEATTLRDALFADTRPDGGQVFTPLVCVGLMVFYVLAMQCVGTLAVVKRETNSWRWPLFQFGYMTLLAYGGALLVFQIGGLFGLQ